MSIRKYDHIDEWLDDPDTSLEEYPAKLWLEKFRAPSHVKDRAWLEKFILKCKFQDHIYVVVGCSAMGDIWLAAPLPDAYAVPEQYERRVSINHCSQWSMMLTSGASVDFENEWRIVRLTTRSSYSIVDCCNRIVLRGDGLVDGLLEEVVKNHNAALKSFPTPFASELEGIPEDAHLHDDPVTDTRIADSEGWGLFDIDSTGILEIQRCDDAKVFSSDDEALVFVRGRANKGSPYHQKAIRIHNKHAEQASCYRDGHMIEKSKLERLEQVAEDTKKVFSYNKHDGTWAWRNRDEAHYIEAGRHGFATRHLALLDATEPYLTDEDE